MTILRDLLGVLAFRTRALQALAGRQAFVMGLVCFSLGFLAFVLVRNTVYAALPELAADQAGPVRAFFRLNLIQAVLFVSLIYVPAIAFLSNAISGGGRGFSMTALEYPSHGSVLFPLWGFLLLIVAPLQYFAPQFLVVGVVGVSVGMFVLLVLLATYTVWAVQRLNSLSLIQALGVFCLSWFTLPIYYLLTSLDPLD
jgi:hypothetical protein